MLIAFAGKAGVGKTTASNYLKNEFQKQGKNCVVLSFATPLKECSKYITDKFSLPDVKYRELLQFLGKFTRQETSKLNYDGILKVMDKALKKYKDSIIIIDDLRMKIEYNFLLEKGFRIMRLVGNEYNEDNMNGGDKKHVTEVDLDDVDLETVDYNFNFDVFKNLFFQ